MRPEKMNLPVGIFDGAKKLRNNRERGEFLMAVLSIFFDGEEVEVSERPDLLLDGWRDRIVKMRDAYGYASSGAKSRTDGAQGTAKGATDDPTGDPSPTLGGTLGQPLAEPTGDPGGDPRGDPQGDPSPTLGGDMRRENRDKRKTLRTGGASAGAEDPAPPTGGERSPRFRAPTVEEVREYASSRGYTFSPEAFVAHYDSNGWKVGRNPMRDWHAACVTWQQREPGGMGAARPAEAAKTDEEIAAEWEAIYAEMGV